MKNFFEIMSKINKDVKIRNEVVFEHVASSKNYNGIVIRVLFRVNGKQAHYAKIYTEEMLINTSIPNDYYIDSFCTGANNAIDRLSKEDS